MKFAAALLLLAAPALAAEIPGIEPVYGATAASAGVTVRLASNGCTRKSDLTVALSKGQPRPILLIARKHPDACKTPGRAEITWTWDELGLNAGQAFSLANPLVAEPAAAPRPAAPTDVRLCQRLEIDAVAPAGKGAVRVLGPQGPVDIEVPPLVAWNEVTAAEAGVTGGQNVVRLSFAPQAAQRLEAWTGAHRGGRIVVLLDGQVIRLAEVSGAIGGAGLEVGGMDRNRAMSVAAGVSACGG
jgi:hypothetical protein